MARGAAGPAGSGARRAARRRRTRAAARSRRRRPRGRAERPPSRFRGRPFSGRGVAHLLRRTPRRDGPPPSAAGDRPAEARDGPADRQGPLAQSRGRPAAASRRRLPRPRQGGDPRPRRGRGRDPRRRRARGGGSRTRPPPARAVAPPSRAAAARARTARGAPPKWAPEDDVAALRDAVARIDSVGHDLDLAQERARQLQDERAAILAEITNRNLYVLSIVTAVFLPMTLVTGVFGMNVGGVPGVESPHGFLWTMVLMAGTGLATYVFLKVTRIV
ncbi:hypothetical protein K6K41_05505 [Chenggangzhangella methanolivorans]|uniref:CorA-like Mg2+ transporter protein n=1 Tax=Chenggangzhangella methanolivorans TaxID=1437009 RepID=A0A9E6RB01_9HYPH|nr:hypothetical protein K6K41_05505 [Chenggangzhangella methanolivorans]